MKKLYLTTAAILAIIPSVFASTDVEAVAVIKTENGPVRIPKSQFNDKQHTLHVADDTHDEHGVARNLSSDRVPTIAEYVAAGYSARTYAKRFSNPVSTPAEIAAAVAAEDANPNPKPIAPARQFGVLQNNKKFFIVNQDGSPVTDIPAFDPKGYSDNASAWGAITAAAMATTDNAS